jgi:hypothetical protein
VATRMQHIFSANACHPWSLRAHAALSPWQGQNALDAAVAAYTNVALLRQQMKPSHRIHGVFEGEDWAANGKRLLAFSVRESSM